MLQYLPNCLTALRLLLALPLGLLILQENYAWALAVSFLAGLTDLLDGFFARRMGTISHFGTILDPIADKLLIMVGFVCLARVDLVPWYLASAVMLRDLVIVIGAAAYYRFIGPFEFAATRLSKINMLIQIGFCVLVLLSQVISGIPPLAILAGSAIVLFIAAASGFDYVMAWSIKAFDARKAKL